MGCISREDFLRISGSIRTLLRQTDELRNALLSHLRWFDQWRDRRAQRELIEDVRARLKSTFDNLTLAHLDDPLTQNPYLSPVLDAVEMAQPQETLKSDWGFPCSPGSRTRPLTMHHAVFDYARSVDGIAEELSTFMTAEQLMYRLDQLPFSGEYDSRLRKERSFALSGMQSPTAVAETQIATDNSHPRRYMKVDEADRIAKEQFSKLWRFDNQSKWARKIGCDRGLVKSLPSWADAKRKRDNWLQLKEKLAGVIDPQIIEAIHAGDASLFGSLPEAEQEKIDKMSDADRDEVLRLMTESAADS